ncbi:kinase-like domain-containing protein, partial [Gigaspora rosea]
LYKYLRKNFCDLTWQAKLEILKNISEELYYIHENSGYIHADFHSGNILQDQRSYIVDLGLSRKTDEKVLEGDIYGVMPYVAPEVLLGEQQFRFGVIMSEMTTGQRPFDGHEFDHKLAFKICKRGLRPEFASGTPKCYIELAKKCMNSDPQERPNSSDIYNSIDNWLEKIASSDNNEIKKQFLEADKVIKSLPISKHPDEMYTSKIISTKSISKAIKNQRSIENIIDIEEYRLKSTADYIKALSMITQIPSLYKYLDQNILPVVADWPGQLFIRKAITLLQKKLEIQKIIQIIKVLFQQNIKNFIPILEPLHVSLNTRQHILIVHYEFFNKLYKFVFGFKKNN